MGQICSSSSDAGPLVHAEPPSMRLPRSDGFRFGELAKPLVVCKEGLVQNPSVGIQVGPVVGKVTDTSAIILIEVTRAAEVTCHCVQVIEEHEENDELQGSWGNTGISSMEQLKLLTFSREGIVSQCQSCEPGKPRAFSMKGLLPDTKYVVIFSDVNANDMFLRTARVRTFPGDGMLEKLRIAAVSSNRPECYGDENETGAWNKLLNLGPQDLVLHLGNNVDCTNGMAEVQRLLSDYSMYKIGVKRQLEQQAANALREAYYSTWNHTSVRECLARGGSHLMIWGPSEMPLEFVGADSSEAGTVEHGAARRVAMNVFHDYQRQLWHVGGALESTVEEWHFHQFGPIGVFVLDTIGNQLKPDGQMRKRPGIKPGEENTIPLLSSKQWNALMHALNEDSMRILVLVSPVPFSQDEYETNQELATSEPELGYLAYEWSARPMSLERLLEEIFDWKQAQYPHREAIFLSGGARVGATCDFRDHKLGLHIPCIVTGPTFDTVHAFESKIDGEIGTRFSYVSRPLKDQWNFVTLEIDLATRSGKPSVDLQLVGVDAPPEARANTRFRTPRPETSKPTTLAPPLGARFLKLEALSKSLSG